MVLSAWTAVFFAWFFLCLFVSMPRWVWQGDTFPPRPKVWEVLTFISNHSIFKEWECLRGFNFHVHFQSFPLSESESAWEVSICIFHFQSFPFSESESVWEVLSSISISIISIFTKWDCLSGFICLKQCCKSLWIWKFFDYRCKFGLNLGAEGQTVRLRGPRSLFHQKFMLNLVLAIIFFLLLQMYVHNHPNNLVLLKLAIWMTCHSIQMSFMCRKSTLELSCGTNRSTLDFFGTLLDAGIVENRLWNCLVEPIDLLWIFFGMLLDAGIVEKFL